MPLSKARDRERKRQQKFQPNSNLNPVQPNIAGLKIEGNKIVGLTSVKPVQPKEGLSPSYPLYNPAIHKPGDRVMVKPQHGKSKKLIEIIIPDVDADGNAVPEF